MQYIANKKKLDIIYDSNKDKDSEIKLQQKETKSSKKKKKHKKGKKRKKV